MTRTSLKYSPLTDEVAAAGTLSSFQLIRANGACTLHMAAEGAIHSNVARKSERGGDAEVSGRGEGG